ncbi:amino acid ABC transporter ATP-binding protein [Lactobacillus xylocopicola]|uniref:Polar amino acid ABC transporter ATP-binding protein n=1 Tax=Lactobacillus xylocopicola TaxID=2976676 RepID=A0ABN6SHW2_9LACO|nr:amino acid ABC transporter ATP-binding protein [Lactobacillus xylocopicola]BDR59887.1 polar amino acid ABC transporter ATP-binding protein [Lactobacillus xylocopicola]
MLKIKNLVKSFNGRKIIANLNLEITDGEILAIVGPSGAGKTTLLRCLAGLETIDAGELTMDGVPFDPAQMANADQVVGIVFQDFQLFPHLSVIENITLAPRLVLQQSKKASIVQAQNLLTDLGLAGKEELFPYQLSGGQKQRVALARALAMKPKVIGYDEPTSALDPELREQVEKVILTLKEQGITQIVVTHDFDFAKHIADEMLKVEAI